MNPKLIFVLAAAALTVGALAVLLPPLWRNLSSRATALLLAMGLPLLAASLYALAALTFLGAVLREGNSSPNSSDIALGAVVALFALALAWVAVEQLRNLPKQLFCSD
jgi:hypothetical protein